MANFPSAVRPKASKGLEFLSLVSHDPDELQVRCRPEDACLSDLASLQLYAKLQTDEAQNSCQTWGPERKSEQVLGEGGSL